MVYGLILKEPQCVTIGKDIESTLNCESPSVWSQTARITRPYLTFPTIVTNRIEGYFIGKDWRLTLPKDWGLLQITKPRGASVELVSRVDPPPLPVNIQQFHKKIAKARVSKLDTPFEVQCVLTTACWEHASLKVSFHSRSQGSQASQQTCVCDVYWYGNMVGTQSAKFGEGLRYSQSSRTCSNFANIHEIRGVVARYGNKKRRFAMLLCFGGTVLVLLFYVRGSKVWHAQSRNPLVMLVVPTFPTSATRKVRSGVNFDLNGNPSIAVAKIRRRWQPQHAAKLASLAICYGN